MGQQLARLGAGDRLGRPPAVQPGPPQRLVGVDVADPADQGLVEQGPLHAGLLLAQPRDEQLVVELGVEGVAGNVGDRGRQVGAARDDGEPAERPLVDEPQLAAAVAEGEPDAQVRLERLLGRDDEELAAHPEMPREGVAGVEREPEVLSPAAGREDRPAGQQVDEVLRAGLVPSDGAGMADLHGGDLTAGHALLQAEPDDLHLGELGHRYSSSSSSAGSSTCSERQAPSAACCSASFLLLPMPSPRFWPATIARATNDLEWSGPLSVMA